MHVILPTTLAVLALLCTAIAAADANATATADAAKGTAEEPKQKKVETATFSMG